MAGQHLGWRGRGKRVWDQAFGSLKAANFGSQGTHSESLLWRMQHGELDGYEAKFVVLHSVGVKMFIFVQVRTARLHMAVAIGPTPKIG